jgi:hypothetical protein
MAEVPKATPMRGTATNLARDQMIWVFTVNPRDPHMNPQPQAAVVQPDGGWSSTAFVGSDGDAGKQFQIFVVVADPGAVNAIKTYLSNANQTGHYPGLAALPDGAREYDRISVVRATP